MRRRIVLYGTATSAAVVVAFLVPLLLLVRTLVADRALGAAQQEAQGLAAVAVVDRAQVPDLLATLNAEGGRQVSLFLADGRVLGAPAEITEAVGLARTGAAFTAETNGGKEVLLPVEGPSGLSVIRVFVPEALLTQGVGQATLTLVVVALLLVLAAMVIAWVVAGRMSRPVVDAAAAAERLAGGDLTTRVEPSGPPEVLELGRGLNQLGERIEHLLSAEREMIADLSHRLRTPITALHLEVDAVPDRELARSLDERVDDLAASVDQVIQAARRPIRTSVPRCDPVSVVAERTAFWSVLAEDQGRDLRTDFDTGSLPVPVDEGELAAAVDALIQNVFAHTDDGVAFEVAVRPTGIGGTRITVADAGQGFVVAEPGRRGTSTEGSTGLGLDIARRCVETVGGRFTLGPSPLGGAEVRMDFPR